jgi:hypothetical protein
VHLEGDGASVTLYVPLDDDGGYRRGAPLPHLLKAVWDGHEWYGEFVATKDKHNRIIWGAIASDSLTNLLTKGIRVGSAVWISEADDPNGDTRKLTVRAMAKL